MKIQYLGHSAFIVETSCFKCIIDPYISKNPLCNTRVEDIQGLTHVLVSHGHGDHMGDCIELAKRNDAVVISNAEICGYLSKRGVKTHSMHIGGKYNFDFGSIKLIVAHHGSGISDGEQTIYGGNPCGFLIKADDKCIYHAGDTALTMDMQLLADEHVDIAMLPIGGNFTMDIDDALKAVKFIKPKAVIPMHYNTFSVIKADPIEFKTRNTACETIVLEYGKTIEL